MKIKILFIDDDPTVLLISKIMLKYLGYDVITADGGVSGIELLKTNNIDLILLDLMIADMCGLDILEYIKEQEEFKNIPVIIQTGVQDNNEINRAYKLGAAHVLLKPYSKKDLKNILEVTCANLT